MPKIQKLSYVYSMTQDWLVFIGGKRDIRILEDRFGPDELEDIGMIRCGGRTRAEKIAVFLFPEKKPIIGLELPDHLTTDERVLFLLKVLKNGIYPISFKEGAHPLIPQMCLRTVKELKRKNDFARIRMFDSFCRHLGRYSGQKLLDIALLSGWEPRYTADFADFFMFETLRRNQAAKQRKALPWKEPREINLRLALDRWQKTTEKGRELEMRQDVRNWDGESL